MFRLDRTAFVIQNMESAAHQRSYWLAKKPQERLAASWYLTCAAWNLDIKKEHRLDRNCFSIRHKSENATKYI